MALCPQTRRRKWRGRAQAGKALSPASRFLQRFLALRDLLAFKHGHSHELECLVFRGNHETLEHITFSDFQIGHRNKALLILAPCNRIREFYMSLHCICSKSWTLQEQTLAYPPTFVLSLNETVWFCIGKSILDASPSFGFWFASYQVF